MQEDQAKGSKTFWLRQAPATIAGVVAIGIVGSTLYDLLVKPGLTSFSRLALDLVTLGSVTLKDAAYSSAALDPTPISALVLLQACLALATFPAASLVAKAFASKDRDYVRAKMADAPPNEMKEELEAELVQLTSKLRRLKLWFWITFTLGFVGLFIAFSVHNQSVVVWRAFHANLAILGPHITQEERLSMQANFAAMETASDYDRIREQMLKLANSREAKLRFIETW